MTGDFLRILKEHLALVQSEIAARAREVDAINAVIAIYESPGIALTENSKPDNQPQAEETAAAPILEIVGTAEPEPDAGASGPAPAGARNPGGRPRDGYGDDEIVEVLRLNREGVDNIEIARRLKLTKGKVAGILFRHRNSDPAPPTDPVLTSTARALLNVIRQGYGDGRVPVWGELARLSGVKKGSLSFVLESLMSKGLVVRDEHGLRPAGKPPLPESMDSEIAKEAYEQIVAELPANQRSAPKTEDEMIAEHLATKGVVHASEEQPTGQQVLDEARRGGRKVAANKELSLFRVGPGAGARMWRDDLLAVANRQRIARGEKPWATTRVRWPNEDGSVPKPIVKEQA